MNDHTDTSVPLVVDLDNTFLRTDCFFEGIFAMLREEPLKFFPFLFKIGNRVEQKRMVEPYILEQAAILPINGRLWAYLEEIDARGREIWLATASPEKIACAIAKRAGIFKGVFATTDEINLKGAAKGQLLCGQFGKGQFDYAGDSLVDVPIWKDARAAVVVSSKKSILAAARSVNGNVVALPPEEPGIKDYIRLVRVRQWVKNILVFLPMLLAHDFSGSTILETLLAFFSLCFCASSIYVLNDLCDLASDRLHPRKKFRPLASGAVSIAMALPLFFGCLAISLAFALFLPIGFMNLLLVYFGATILYSLFFKKMLFLDVTVLAILYVLRIIAGGAAIGAGVSNWLLGFAGFFFLGLALFKRVGGASMINGEEKISGRAYLGKDRSIMESMGLTSGFCSIVIVALYIDSLQAMQLYHHPEWLWLACPLLVYWYGRIGILTARGEIQDDPVNFAVGDKISWLVAALLVLTLCLAL